MSFGGLVIIFSSLVVGKEVVVWFVLGFIIVVCVFVVKFMVKVEKNKLDV